MPGHQQRYLHVQATPLTGKGADRIGVLIVLHDLTRLRQLESVRRDFVANVSHELKTPITAIRGAVKPCSMMTQPMPRGSVFCRLFSNRISGLMRWSKTCSICRA